MIVGHIVTHSLVYAGIVNGYLLLLMVTMSSRIWGYSDYPDRVKSKVPPQTRREKLLAGITGLPWLLFVVGFPVLSTYLLKAKLGNEISFWLALLSLTLLTVPACLGDVIILDWLVITKITPRFVVMPGTEAKDYKDFSRHFRAHAKAGLVQMVLSVALAGVVWYF